MVTDNAQMQVELETLKSFRDRVDGLLASLDAGPAAPKQIAGQTLEPAYLGSGFGEISDLVGTYTQVHAQLQGLSQTLSDQINAMSITIQVSQVGYQNVEADQVDALWAIQGRTQQSVRPPTQDGLTVQQQLDAAKKSGTAQQTTAQNGTSPTNQPPGRAS